MLIPARTKFRKQHRGRMKGMAKGGKYLAFGSFGLQALDPHWITSAQLEAARKVITRTVKRAGKMWIRVFPDKPVSKKPLEVRMGKGKGAPEFWVAVVKPGKILFELEGVPENIAVESLTQAANKLPIRCQVVSNNM
ncbi:MAG TPA: 50S ribosomal protein L16 [Candidatus Riflebacteria bacterium]|jgi:large subunit ribosomal protein L16|nr:ribosomal protein L16 [uncultured bacterium]OGK06648.1 MAG: 50S ribosomal protein L16 [Candidatus Riflebacteria bacterium GWC2_50_8]HAE37861.1 50S ribosomal protein L16 [Candidatus Riflebacteria bacterium]